MYACAHTPVCVRAHAPVSSFSLYVAHRLPYSNRSQSPAFIQLFEHHLCSLYMKLELIAKLLLLWFSVT